MKLFLLIGAAFILLAVNSCNNNQAAKKYSLKIAYNVLYDEENDDYEIFIMNMDGTEKKNISNWKGVDWVYYAYEDKLYFLSDRDTSHRKYFLYEMDADGNNIRKITNFLLEDSWLSSRNTGNEFVVSSFKDGKRHELYIIDKNGNEIMRLSNNDIYENDPCFSPDGNQIVFRSRQSGIDELWIMDANGANRRQLTHYPENDSTGGEHFYHAGPPFWEPNRNIISYSSKQNGNYSIFTIKPDGSNLLQITSDEFDEVYHTWSPDGNWIAFDRKSGPNNYDICLMRSDGSDIRQLTTNERYDQAPVFVKYWNE